MSVWVAIFLFYQLVWRAFVCVCVCVLVCLSLGLLGWVSVGKFVSIPLIHRCQKYRFATLLFIEGSTFTCDSKWRALWVNGCAAFAAATFWSIAREFDGIYRWLLWRVDIFIFLWNIDSFMSYDSYDATIWSRMYVGVRGGSDGVWVHFELFAIKCDFKNSFKLYKIFGTSARKTVLDHIFY